MRQCPVGLLDHENISALKAMRANDGGHLATARMKSIEDPILGSRIPGIMPLSRAAPARRMCVWLSASPPASAVSRSLSLRRPASFIN
jgi:hypothetical protein